MKVLVLNSGSSSVKFQLIRMEDESLLAKDRLHLPTLYWWGDFHGSFRQGIQRLYRPGSSHQRGLPTHGGILYSYSTVPYPDHHGFGTGCQRLTRRAHRAVS